MNNTTFLTKSNVYTIWDVISDELIFKNLSKEQQQQIANIFTNNIKGFYDTELLKKSNLIDMNKKYIILILNYIKTNFSNKLYKFNKIKIHEEIIDNQKELVTYEEIQNDKKTQFEKNLNKRQEDFANLMSISVPPVPEFKDTYKNEPITEMEQIIKEMTAQRKYDIEQITKINNSTESDAWLQSQETSIKNDKIQQDKTVLNTNQIKENNNKLKYFKMENDEIILNNLTVENKKNVTWGENVNINETNINEEDNIFKKLKKVETIKNPELDANVEPEKNTINIITERINKISNEINEIKQLLQQIIKK